jgi:Na+-driven multidrug efflux pump
LRIIQASFLPVVALGFAVGPVAGQNFGARRGDRVRATFYHAAGFAVAGMVVAAAAANVAGAAMVGAFSSDPAVIAVGEEYLRVVSWSFAASGIIFVSSSMFQAMGNTMPALIASFTRLVAVSVPVLLLARTQGFALRWVWDISVATILLQMVLILLLLRREFRTRLAFSETVVAG